MTVARSCGGRSISSERPHADSSGPTGTFGVCPCRRHAIRAIRGFELPQKGQLSRRPPPDAEKCALGAMLILQQVLALTFLD